jgi:SMC interacting uncharacterized protein involved in chromosome segregation
MIKRVILLIRRDRKMARKANYDEKISALEAKIEKKHAELKALKADLDQLKAKKSKEDYRELTEYMQANNLSASEVLSMIK